LTAAVWSRNLSTAKRVASQVVCGVVNINGPTHGAEPVMPFGGFKDSGNGTREAGIESLFEYSNIRVTSTFID
jgi:aldehyde dehydrogenase (NAD+)